MAVIFRCKSKMAAAFCSILRLFHGSKSKAADLWLVWKSLNALQNSLDLLRGKSPVHASAPALPDYEEV